MILDVTYLGAEAQSKRQDKLQEIFIQSMKMELECGDERHLVAGAFWASRN